MKNTIGLILALTLCAAILVFLPVLWIQGSKLDSIYSYSPHLFAWGGTLLGWWLPLGLSLAISAVVVSYLNKSTGSK